MDGYNLDIEAIEYINDIIPGGKIYEFGSGDGTLELLKEHDVFSIESQKEYFISRGKNHIIFLAEIKNGWYDADVLKDTIKDLESSDLILIDGPPKKMREGILNNLDIFNNFKGVIIFDDVNRELDFSIMKKFAEHFKLSYEIFAFSRKNIGVLKK